MQSIKKTIKKILPQKAYSAIKKIIKPSRKIDYYPLEEIITLADRFKLKKVAILTDGNTSLNILTQQTSFKITNIYTFNLETIGHQTVGFEIKPLPPSIKIETDGWIVSSLNETDSFSLNRYLIDNDSESQVILQHVKMPNSTKYYSYVDFFANEQQTIVHINNYFRRCYALPFPIDIRLTLRDLKGQVIKTSQVILPPDAIRVIRSEEYGLKDFAGYLEVEFEISKRVTPFLHYMVDYLSPHFISSNHQSGLGLHPANSEFTRGYVPTEKDRTLKICLFQHNYDNPVIAKAILTYTDQNGQSITRIRNFPPLYRKQMLYCDVKELFDDVDFSKAHSPVVVTKADVPLHRPNYYYTMKGKSGFYDTSHAGPDLKNHVKTTYRNISITTDEEKNIFSSLNITPMDMRHHVLPSDMRIHSIISVGGNDSTAINRDFSLDLYDLTGNHVQTFEDTLDFERERYLNLSEYIARKGFGNFSGTVAFRPGLTTTKIPISMNSITGYIHRDSRYLTSTAGSGSSPDNISLYWRGGPPNYLKLRCSTGITDIFARGISNDSFDTIYTVSYATGDSKLKKNISYEIQITNILGEKKILQRSMKPNACDVLRLSDLIKESGHSDKRGFYTIWLFSSDAHLYAQHILIRKKDNAIAVEHFYAGKFGL